MNQPNKGEYDEGGDKVVGLVVDQVVHHPVRPPASVAGVGHFKPVTSFVKDFDQMDAVVLETTNAKKLVIHQRHGME